MTETLRTGDGTAIPGLIGNGLLHGQHEITTLLRPERLARPVAVTDMSGALAEVERLCQTWGGAGHPLLPVKDGRVPSPYWPLLGTEQVDAVAGLQDVTVELPWRVDAKRHAWDFPVLMIASREPKDRYLPVQVVELSSDDPWHPIYAAVLGSWPEAPDPVLSEFAFMREDLRFDDIVPVQRVHAVGSLDDLLGRLSDRSVRTPRQTSNTYMAAGMQPDASFMGLSERVLPEPTAARRAAGPNIIVAVSPGSVEDLALLWNLRGAHGDNRALPIGVPADQIDAEILGELQEPGRATMFGWRGGKCHLTSTSVPLPSLTALAAQSPTVVAVGYDEVLTFGLAPGRTSHHVTWWEAGRTRIAPLSDADRDVLSPTAGHTRQPRLLLDVTVAGHRIPADGTMRGSEYFARFQAGAAQVAVPDSRQQHGTVEVAWPATWTCLAAVAHTRGLAVSESEPGVAAATLIRALGSVHMIALLQHRPLIDLLYRMAERSGMAWRKNKLNEELRSLRKQAAERHVIEAAEALQDEAPAIAPAGEGRDVPFGDFIGALGSEPAAKHWVAWAERRHLLVRGAQVVCPDCRAKSWLPMGALPPPITCPGCGRQIDQPYGPRELQFTYRLGEPIRRVLETDSLGHILALRWFHELYRPGTLVGAHPGVTFTDPSTGKDIGEADVLLLFPNGDLVPVEVKRRVAGIAGAAAKMDTLADALASPFDVLAVTQPARDCQAMTDLGRRMPERPRLLLTDDQLLAQDVIWALGSDPFAWEPLPADKAAERERDFSRWLADNDPDVPWDRTRDTLLNPALRA